MTEATTGHRTVNRVTTILELVAASASGRRLHELARDLDAPKSSIFGLVKGLVSTGYLVEESGTYRLGPALTHLLAAERPSLVDAARPSLDALRDRFDETATLTTALGDSMTYVASAESRQMIRYSAPLRVRRPLFPPSPGKVILAYRPAARRTAYLAHVLEPERLDDAEAELEQVRSEGVAFNRGETLADVSAAARPILRSGRVLGVISVAGPTSRVADRLPEIADALAREATEVEHRL